MNSLAKFAVFFFKGAILGLSMAIPGLSGGTMAFVMGIYKKLLEEINKFQPQKILWRKLLKPAFKVWFLNKKRGKNPLTFRFSLFNCKKTDKKNKTIDHKTALHKTKPIPPDWGFLIPLIMGLVVALFVFVSSAVPLIKNHSVVFYSMVSGLIMASLIKPFMAILCSAKNLTLFFVSLVLGVGLFSLGQGFVLFSGEFSSWVFMMAGFLVAGALIVPGISGSYLLVILGLYEKLLIALREFDVVIICYFLMGAIMGGFLIAGGIYKMIKNYFLEMSAILSGLVLSSLYAIFPLANKPYSEILLLDLDTRLFVFGTLGGFVVFIGLEILSSKKSPSDAA